MGQLAGNAQLWEVLLCGQSARAAMGMGAAASKCGASCLQRADGRTWDMQSYDGHLTEWVCMAFAGYDCTCA